MGWRGRRGRRHAGLCLDGVRPVCQIVACNRRCPVRVSYFSLLEFDSRALPEREAFATFASAMVNFEVTAAGDGPFTAQAKAWKVGAIVIARLLSSPVRYARSAARIAADEVDHLYINLHLDGHLVADCGAGPLSGGSGSLLVVDLRHPCWMDVGDIDQIAVAIPRRLLSRLRPFEAHGLMITGGLADLLGRSLCAVTDSLADLDAAHGPVVERMIVDQVCDTLLQALQAGDAGRSRDALLVSRVRTLMDDHLSEPLDAAAICAALGVSRSSLYRAFEGRGGVLRDLQRRRLRRVRAHLETAGETRSIAVLAELTGFADKAHLTRAFKREFGVTPSQVRAQTTTRKPIIAVAEHQAAQLFHTWVSRLE